MDTPPDIEAWLDRARRTWSRVGPAKGGPMGAPRLNCHKADISDGPWVLSLGVNRKEHDEVAAALSSPTMASALATWDDARHGPLQIILFVPNTEKLVFFWSTFEPAYIVEGGRLVPKSPGQVNLV